VSLRIKKRIVTGTLSIALAALATTSSGAQAQAGSKSEPIFRIGNFDRSSHEFAKGTPEKPVDFLVGQSTASKDWYGRQPAIANSTETTPGANHAADPRTITFTLDHNPETEYRLRAGFIVITGAIPQVRITINNEHGKFYLHPTLDYSNGEVADAFYSAYSYAMIDFEFSGKLLHHGENQLTLQAIESEDQDAPDCYLTYDAVELEKVGKNSGPQAAKILVAPTIFFKSVQNSLEEEVDVFVQHSEPVQAKDYVDLEIAGKKHHDDLRSGDDFGEKGLSTQ
jgi:alpha-mannosidase